MKFLVQVVAGVFAAAFLVQAASSLPEKLSVELKSSGFTKTARWKESLEEPLRVTKAGEVLKWKLFPGPAASSLALLVFQRTNSAGSVGTPSAKTYRFLTDGVVSVPVDRGGMMGEYEITVHVRDADVDAKAQSWNVGTVIVNYVASKSFGDAPKEEDRLKDFFPLPEIHHVFQRKEKSPPPTFLAYIFTGIVLLPWLFFIPAWTRLGVNVSNFPWKISEILSSVGFVGSLAALMACFFLYWTRWNMFEAIVYIAPCALVTAFMGKQAITQYATRK